MLPDPEQTDSFGLTPGERADELWCNELDRMDRGVSFMDAFQTPERPEDDPTLHRPDAMNAGDSGLGGRSGLSSASPCKECLAPSLRTRIAALASPGAATTSTDW